ncbi:unnamed protein product [Urochloa decumbens]|uniref:Uncharacterized protein n=1 Tax=Urochloa decumbens TaxID=240449 RepID=A0ABC9DTV2_9POAL
MLKKTSHFNRTLVRLHSTLYRVGRDLQEQRMTERDLGSTLREFLQELSLDRAHLQPPNVLRCLDVIATALRALLAAAAHGRIAGPLDYTELNHCVQYILKRIKSLDQEQVNYPRDADPFEAFPLDDEQPAAVNGIDQEAEDESDYDDTEDDMAYYDISLQPEEEIDPDAPPWVSDSDASDDIMGYVLIRGLENLQYIRKSPNKEASEEFSWIWVGNMERLRQAHSISRTLGLVHRALDRLGSYIQDNRMDRALDLLNAVPSVNPAVRDSEPPRSIDFPDLCVRLQFIMERMDSLDNQHVRYNKDVERPEVLPPLPFPSP